ncbi:MAG: phosphotransferase [Acinetobacter sp.]
MNTSTAGLGHGMGTAWEQKDWAHLSELDVQQLQQHFSDLQGHADIIWRSPRPFSSAALIQVNQHRYFVKRSHRSFRKAEDLIQEHQFIAHLAQKGLAVPKVLIANHGFSAIEIGEWSYEVHHQAQGVDIYADHQSWKPFFFKQHAHAAGQILAKMHLAALDYTAVPPRSAQYLVSNQQLLEYPNIVEAIVNRIEHSPALTAYFHDKSLDQNLLVQLQHFHQPIHARIVAQPKLWTHNDLHASNLLWSSDAETAQITAVIDFGLSDCNSIAYDIAVTIERNFIDWLQYYENKEITVDEQGLQAFILAYLSEYKPVDALRLVPQLLPIVHVDFAISELEYFMGITHNVNHADAAYFDWLIGHTQWFVGEQGQAFLARLTAQIEQGIEHDSKTSNSDRNE